MKKLMTGFGLSTLVLGLAFTFAGYGSAAASGLEKWGTPGPGNTSTDGTGSGQRGQASTGNGGGVFASGTPVVSTPVSEAEKIALQQAIAEEYKAFNLYKSVIEQYGNVTPFSRIADSEAMHANALARTLSRYGVAVPQNTGLTSPPVFASLQDACAAGVDAELTDAALYDDLISVTSHADVNRVYQNLQAASLKNHLPAFEACR